MKKRIIIGIVIMVMATGVVLALSSMSGEESSAITKGIASRINHFLKSNNFIEINHAYEIEIAIRKLAHFIEYQVLTLIVFGVIYMWTKRLKLSLLVSLILLIPLPLVDEFIIQSRAGRTSHLFDVVIDLAGIFSVHVYLLLFSALFTLTGKESSNQKLSESEAG